MIPAFLIKVDGTSGPGISKVWGTFNGQVITEKCSTPEEIHEATVTFVTTLTDQIARWREEAMARLAAENSN